MIKLKNTLFLLTVLSLSACGGGGGGSDTPVASTPAPVAPVTSVNAGGTAIAPAVVALIEKNTLAVVTASNYFKYTAVAGERMVVRVNLTTPLSDTEAARCASSDGTGAIPSGYSTQIHIYNPSNARVGGICGEDLTYSFAESGTYVFNFEFPYNSGGYFNAASLTGIDPVAFVDAGAGTPVAPKKMSLTTTNAIGDNPFVNYFWVAAVKGETIVINATLNQPLTTEQKTRCSASSESHNSQIYVYDAKMNRVGLACSENIRYQVPESGNYIVQFNYGKQSAGIFNAAKL